MNEKKCSRCNTIKPISDFFQRKDRVNQFSAWCRECLRWNSQRYYNSPQGQKQYNQYGKSDARKQALMKYNVSEKRKAVTKKYESTGAPKDNTERRKQNDPDYKKKRAARAKAEAALKKGSLSKKPCEYIHLNNCHGRIEMHHPNYDKPLEVRWLCDRHHKFVDNHTLS